MKFKRTFLKSGSIRRLLSTVLAATLVTGLLPVSALASGTGYTGSTASVEYNRKSPEAAILNYYTGNSKELYKKIKEAAANRHEDLSQYNAMTQVLGVPYNSTVPDATYTWDDKPSQYWPSGLENTGVTYADSQIRALSEVYGNLEVNISGDFTNYVHTHSHRHGTKKYEYTVTNYTSVTLQMGSSTPVVIGGSYPENGLNYVRVGDYGAAKGNVSYDAENPGDSYGKVPYSNSDTFELKVTQNQGSYQDQGQVKSCTCGTNFSHVDNMLLTFRDPLQPALPTVYYSLDGTSWTPSANGLRVKGGSTLYIKLSYNEPIRFADDNADEKGKLYLELQANGESTGSGRKAGLYKLDGNDLYFSYAFTQSDVDLNIQTLDMSSLFPANEVSLVQVNKKDRQDWANGNGALKENFTLDSSLKNSENGTTGFLTTTCYITDLAGNALMKPASGGLMAGNLILDSVNPYVENVEFNLTLNNGDVKKELGKTDPSDNTSYTDNSDLYLGVGDKVSLVLNMNERLKISTLSGYTAVATTNIKKADNSYVTVESKYSLPESEVFDRDITSWVMKPITLEEGWSVSDADGQIKVTALRFVDSTGNSVNFESITDQAGNPLKKSAGDATSVHIDTGANANPPWLDVTAPTVEPYGVETPDETTGGFYYAVSISDTGSGVAGLSGKFVLRNGTETAGGDGKNYSFEYAVTGSADTPVDTSGNTVWKTGRTGVAYDLIQLSPVYIHIRPKTDETYINLSACTFTVKTQDYAGNKSNVTLPPNGTLDWYIDNAVPTVKGGETRRTLSAEATGGGTLTAEITLSDGKGISAWQYGWSDSKTAEPTSWTDGALAPEERKLTSVTRTVSAAVAQGESFSKYLWVKATDNSNKQNTATVCLRQYTYDLSKTQYNLDYSTGITVKASMKVSSIGENDSLFFLVKPNNESSEYALLRVDGESGENSGKNGDIFDGFLAWTSGDWSYGWTLAEANGIYTLTRTAGADISSVMQDQVLKGLYRGEVTVVLLSGKKGGTDAPSNIDIYLNRDNSVTELVLGNGSHLFSMDTVTLRAASHNKENFTGITITTDSDLGGDQTNHGAVSLEYPARASLAGIEFQITVGEDIFGWNYDDVDWDHSYVELTQGVNSDVSYKFNLREPDENGTAAQTLTIPERDFASGVYYAKLYIDCFAGYDIERIMKKGDPLEGETIFFVVDNVKPVSDFTFTLTYAPDEKAYYNTEDKQWYASNRYGITDIYETRVCQSENGVITLPVADGVTFGTDYPGETYQFTVTSEDEQPVNTSNVVSPYGWYQLQIWNKAYPENTLTIDPTDSSQKTVKSNDGTHSGSLAYGFVFDENKTVGDSGKVQYIYLEPDVENTVCIRKAYSNGTFSDLQEVRIKPVTQHITGTVSIDSTTNQLVFTPTNVLSTLGARIYAWAWQDGQDAENKGEGQRIDMTPAADGTWRCDLLENGARYEVITLNSVGSVCDAGGCSAHAPIVGIGESAFNDTGNGTYELHFTLSDEYNTVQNGLKLDIGFNDAYSTDHLSFTVEGAYSWTATEVSATGIYAVDVVKYSDNSRDSLGVTVKGCYRNVTGTDMNITVTATDAMGYTASASTGEQTVAYQQPVIWDEAATVSALRPKLGNNGLVLNFSQPVQPVNSWAWQESDPDAAKGFRTQWAGAFPVAGKGTYTLQFVDLFGNICSQELTVSADVFTRNGTDYSMGVIFSSTATNVESVAVYTFSENGYLTFYGTGDDYGTIWEKEDASGAYIYETVYVLTDLDNQNIKEWRKYASSSGPASSMSSSDASLRYKNLGAKSRDIRWHANGKMTILCNTVRQSDTPAQDAYSLTVYISSIAPKTAPTAQVRYYACDLGQGFTQAELEQYIVDNKDSEGNVTFTGNVRVWYETDRSVTPTEGGSEFLFTPTNYQDSHTFKYVDELNHEGSVTVALPAGLTLKTPDNPPEDTIAPVVSVGITARRGDSYTQEGGFHYTEDSAAITEKFAALGYVQSCLLTVAASDTSGFTIAVSGDGATLSGNIVTITKAGTFTITVTDQSTNQNATVITFTVPSKIDTTPPTVKDITVSGDIYTKILTITLADRNDTGNDTGEVTLSLPTEAVRDESKLNTYTYTPGANGTVEFEFYDQAGNRGTATYSVSGIDTEPSELSVTWSPSRERYSELPPTGPVNTDVTARIRSNKAIYNLTVQAANETSAHELLVGGVVPEQPYSITGPDGKPLVTFDVTPELVTVTYSGNYGQSLIFTATAPNGLDTELTLSGLYNVIDKTEPDIQVEQTELKRDGYSKPYSVKVTLRPTNELVTSPNYGETRVVGGVSQPVQYDFNDPLVLTFTEEGTYKVRFADTAGNVTIKSVVIADVDNKAPKLEVVKDESNNQVKATVTVDEDCTVTAQGTSYSATKDTPIDITFTDNGTFAITATDAAGNESLKMVRVGSIDNEAPSISFTKNTIYVKQGSSADGLATELGKGYTVWDNVTAADALTVRIDHAVDLNTAGQYIVTYTVTDAAGNVTTANRFVRVIGSDTVCLNVDGNLILPDSTAVLRPGNHSLTLENNNGEPYSVKARRNVLSAGQMKYLSGSSLSFDENGRFSVTAAGYYTLLVTTQSRQTIRILLYVEQ